MNSILQTEIIKNILQYSMDRIKYKPSDLVRTVNDNYIISAVYSLENDNDIFDKRIRLNMQSIHNALVTNTFSNVLNADNGMLNISWSVLRINHITSSFKKFSQSINLHMEHILQQYIVASDENLLFMNYDFFSFYYGMAGISNYLLEVQDKYSDALLQSIDIIANVCNRVIALYEEHKGIWKLGLENGTAGYLAVLLKAYQSGISKNKLLRIFQKFIFLYKTNLKFIDGTFYWPAEINMSEKKVKMNYRESLACGSIYMGYLLLYISNVIECRSGIIFYKNIMSNKSKLNIEDFGVYDLSVKRGYSGLLCIFNECYMLTGDKEFENICLRMMDKFNIQTDNFLSQKCIWINERRICEKMSSNNISFYEGTAGAVLTLMSSFIEKDRLFLTEIGL